MAGRGTGIVDFKPPQSKPMLDHKTFLVVVHAHRDGRHGHGSLNYWAGICPVCWRKLRPNS